MFAVRLCFAGALPVSSLARGTIKSVLVTERFCSGHLVRTRNAGHCAPFLRGPPISFDHVVHYRHRFGAFARHFSTTRICWKKRKTEEERVLEKRSVFPNKARPKSDSKIVTVWRNMTVLQLADAMDCTLDHVFEVMLYVNDCYRYDQPYKCIDNPRVLQEIIKKSGMRYQFGSPPVTVEQKKEVKDVTKRPPAAPSQCVPRHPVVTIMGHVDHGKTTLLDYLRHSSVVESEFGGITQHIGAFEVRLDSGEMITFLDTPGHAAFTAMRSRGAQATDIVILVVAADDGVMEQTTESIRLANEAKVPIIVAINKIDKPEADIERTKKMLMMQGLMLEDAGGDVQTVPISALKGTGVAQLVDAINAEAALLDLRADAQGFVEGVVVESRTDPHRGKLSTAIVQRGTLRKGSYLVAGSAWARVRSMFNDRGQPIQLAPPSTPVEIIGWRDLPSAGDEIIEVESERKAAEVTQFRRSLQMEMKALEDVVAIEKKAEEHRKEYKATLEERRRMGWRRYQAMVKSQSGPAAGAATTSEESTPKLSVVIKGDVDGSVEAILDVLDTYYSAQCHLDVVHYGVGAVCENDVKLAEAFDAVVYAFNVAVPAPVKAQARANKVAIKESNIIYRLIDDVKAELNQRLPTQDQEEVLGEANVLEQFLINEGRTKVPVAGCRCVKGVLKKSGQFRLVRGQDVLYDGPVSSIRHLKNEVDTIKKDVECGVRLQDTSVHLQSGDTLLCYEMKQVAQVTDWDPGF